MSLQTFGDDILKFELKADISIKLDKVQIDALIAAIKEMEKERANGKHQ